MENQSYTQSSSHIELGGTPVAGRNDKLSNTTSMEVRDAHMTHDELSNNLCRIPGVLGANVVFDESGELDEVHIMADCSRPAREVMLDAKSVLFVCLKSPIDFRKISVARIDTSADATDEGLAATSRSSEESVRIMLVASYVKRLSSEQYQVVVELRLGDKSITGSSEGTVGCEPVQQVSASAAVDALSTLLPGVCIASQVQLLGSYCIADLVVTDEKNPHGLNLVGAVKCTGDMPWDVSRAVLKALNRKLSLAVVDYINASSPA